MDKTKAINQLIEDFCADLAATTEQKVGTIGNYRSDICRFSEWFKSEHGGKRSLLDTGNPELEGYRHHLVTNFKPATVNRRVAAINNFFCWAERIGRMESAPGKLRTLRLRETRRGSALGERDLAKVLKVVGAGGTPQEHLIIRLLIETNLQLSELCGIRWIDLEISPSAAVLSVQNTIPRRWRSITLGRECKRLFLELGYKAKEGSSDLVLTEEEHPIAPSWIQELVGHVARTAGVKVTPLILRRSLQAAQGRDHQVLSAGKGKREGSLAGDEPGKSTESKIVQENLKSRTSLEGPLYDTFQDLYIMDSLLHGYAFSKVLVTARSGIVRDLRIRKTVLRRSCGRCERCGFPAGQIGIIEVHHIIPAARKDDRYDNCVALCPNCHRLAHLKPRCKEVERELLTIVRRLVLSVDTHYKAPEVI